MPRRSTTTRILFRLDVEPSKHNGTKIGGVMGDADNALLVAR